MVQLAGELVERVSKSGTHVTHDATSVTLPLVENKVVWLLANLKKACEEAVSAKAESDAFRATAQFATKEYIVASTKVREELQDEVETWKATTSQSKASLTKLRKEMSVEVKNLKLRS